MNRTEEIQQELQEMASRDDAVMAVTPRVWADVNALRKEQGEKLKEIIAEIGWPKFSEYGEQAGKNAWLVLIHMDYDVEFQKHCLELMQSLTLDELTGQMVAQLVDRIMVKEDGEQLYGTQRVNLSGGSVLYPVRDLEEIDIRRRRYGLNPILEHLATLSEKVYLTGEAYTQATGLPYKDPILMVPK